MKNRGQGHQPHTRRIRVALDSASSNHDLLQAAVNLAAGLEARLEGLLIEDANLIRLASLPFARQISRHSPIEELVAGSRIERELKVRARKLEEMLNEIASHENVETSFRVVRGMIDHEIRAAANAADLLALWGASRSLERHSGIAPTTGVLSMRLLRSKESARRTPPETGSELAKLANAGEIDILILGCQNPALKEELVQELIRQRGRHILLVSA